MAAGSLALNRALVSNGAGNVIASSVTATELNYLTGLTTNIQDFINKSKDNTSGKKIWIQKAQPSSPSDGDLWVSWD